jgi:hypothetical protein
MFGSATRALRVGSALAAGAAVVAAAGCSGTSSSSSAPQGAASTTPAASSPAASSPAASQPASSAPASAPSSASSPRAGAGNGTGTAAGGGGAGGATACASASLQVKIGTSEGAAGSLYQVIDFTNGGSKACTLYGYPGVSLSDGAGPVGAAATRSAAAAPAVVNLAPGATANALLRITQAANYPSSTCSPKATSLLHIYPPNETVAIDVAFKATACGKDGVKLLTIGVIQPGANSRQ